MSPSLKSTLLSALLIFPGIAKAGLDRLPPKIYGVNLGSWLVLEAWMLKQEWVNMGGENCNDCSQCIGSEFAMAKAYPDTVDQTFDGHWTTWFNQKDVNDLVDVGINTVRIPLGYWIVESLVNRTSEFFPKGGIRHLRRGLKQLKDAGIIAILDHHALPGVQEPGQQFTGRCTSDVEFYTPYNYHRALVWTAVITALSHIEPDFSNVVAIQAVNEEIMDASKTPGYGDFTKNFVMTMRAVELALGIPIEGFKTASSVQIDASANVTSSMLHVSASTQLFNDEVRAALKDAVPALLQTASQLGIASLFGQHPPKQRESLISNFMDITWQFGDRANPADAAIGPQGYDNHLYYSFGGVADPTEDAYLNHSCHLNRVETAASFGNSPLWFGEWGLPTQFAATDEFLFKWADAQKLAYSKGAGWLFWNFKIEISDLEGDTARQWSYLEGVRRGYLTKDPAAYNNASVCDPYLQSSAS